MIEDKITEDIRNIVFERFDPRDTKIGYLFTCPWCVSIWAGLVIFGLYRLSPATAEIMSAALAASQLTGYASDRGL